MKLNSSFMNHMSSDLQLDQLNPNIKCSRSLSQDSIQRGKHAELSPGDSVPSIFHIHMIYVRGGEIYSKVKSKVCKCVCVGWDLFSTV